MERECIPNFFYIVASARNTSFINGTSKPTNGVHGQRALFHAAQPM
jgi:hypothetical protein